MCLIGFRAASWRRVTALAAALLVVAVACGDATVTARQRHLIHDVSAALEATDDAAQHLHDEVERRVGDCMRRQGFDYRPEVYTALPVNESSLQLDPNIGYPRPPKLGSAATERGGDGDDDPRWYTALTGTRRVSFDDANGKRSGPANGCLADSQRAVYGGKMGEWSDVWTVVTNSINGFSIVARRDAAVASADRRWASCMGRAGYRISSVFSAEGAAASLAPDDSRQQAVADASCRRETGIVSAYRRAYDAAVAEHIGDTESALRRYLQLTQQAERQLGDGG